MAFEICDRVEFAGRRLSGDEASITARKLSVCNTVVENALIDGECTLLADKANMRVAIREPREDEPTFSVNKGKHCSSVNATPAIRKLGLDPDNVRGRFPCVRKDDLIIIGPIAELPADE